MSSITITKKAGSISISAKGESAQALFNELTMFIAKPAKKNLYVIRVAPEVPRFYLAAESDEDDGEPESSPPRMSEHETALTFDSVAAAQAALQAALVRYPTHQFLIRKVVTQ